jgi:hypothetical protein
MPTRMLERWHTIIHHSVVRRAFISFPPQLRVLGSQRHIRCNPTSIHWLAMDSLLRGLAPKWFHEIPRSNCITDVFRRNPLLWWPVWYVSRLWSDGREEASSADERLSMARGLSDEMWELVETCCTDEPTHRPTAAQVAERLLVLPNQPVDQRPVDAFIPPQRLYNRSEHPFSAHVTFEQSHLRP